MSSIFGTRTQQTNSQEELEAPVFEGYGVENNGDILAIQESFEDHLHIVQSLHGMEMAELQMKQDVRALQENGASEEAIQERMEEYEVVAEAASGSALEKVKSFFSKLWGKIQGYFAEIVRWFDARVKSAEGFVKKYEKDLVNANLEGYEAKSYEYSNLDQPIPTKEEVKAKFDGIFNSAMEVAGEATGTKGDELRAQTRELKENRTDILNKFRGEILGTSSLSPEQFQSKLFGFFRSGATGKEDMKTDKVDIQAVIGAIKSSAASKKEIEKAAQKNNEQFKAILTKINAVSKQLKGKEHKTSVDVGQKQKMALSTHKDNHGAVLEALRVYSGVISGQKDIEMAVFRAWRNAWNERDTAYKSIVVGALGHKQPKEKKQKEDK